MKNIFDIENFNIIKDDENYYFFRALNMADNQDIEDGITVDEKGQIIKVRTDRERYLEKPENGVPKYNEDDEISLEQAHDHIKINYRKDTNCISLTTDSSIAINYGRVHYKDNYIMIKVPKKEFGVKVRFAGKYLLDEIEKRINNYIKTLDFNNKHNARILKKIEIIEKSKSIEEIEEIVKTFYKGIIDYCKSNLKKDIRYKAPSSRFRTFSVLNDAQNMAISKIIGKLTLLEKNDKYTLIKNEKNSNVIVTIYRAFCSLELLHYGFIDCKEIQEITSETMDEYALIQQNK